MGSGAKYSRPLLFIAFFTSHPSPLSERLEQANRRLEREIKNEDIFLLEERHENFVAAVRKWEMLAATKVKMSGNEKKSEQEHVYDISSSKRVTRKFLEVSRCGRTKQRHRNVEKKCAARAKLLFC